MNKQELDERITSLIATLVRPDVLLDQQKEKALELIRDCIEAVTPERATEDVIAISLHGKPDDAKDDWTPQESAQLGKAFNSAIDTIEANTKELLGDKQS